MTGQARFRSGQLLSCTHAFHCLSTAAIIKKPSLLLLDEATSGKCTELIAALRFSEHYHLTLNLAALHVFKALDAGKLRSRG